MDPKQAALDKFGKERAEEIRSDLEQLAADIEKLRAVPVELDDEP